MKPLLPLDDPRWKHYRSGYSRGPMDVTEWIQPLLSARRVDSVHWDFLWQELHHQGTVGEASYAVIPYLARYVSQSGDLPSDIFAFAAIVELRRTESDNPPIPHEIEDSYAEALQVLPRLAVSQGSPHSWSEAQIRSVSACLALSKGNRLLARAFLELNEEAARRVLAEECGVDVNDL